MLTITDNDIKNLNITPQECIEWVNTSFLMKNESILPVKSSIHLRSSDFFNTMPCLLPEPFDTFSVKVVSRITSCKPALKSTIMLFRASTGERLALIDADWITSMRTGAVAALASETFKKTDARVYAFMGLGSTAISTMKCLTHLLDRDRTVIRLLRYKDQCEKFINRFRYTGLSFELAENMSDFIDGADVVFSCITHTDSILCPDSELFRPGVLVIPVHTRGFQNCDTVFDKVYADDTDHVRGFRNFSGFRNFDEIGNVLTGKAKGRESDSERILSYNIGLGIHDAYFAYRIYDNLCK